MKEVFIILSLFFLRIRPLRNNFKTALIKTRIRITVETDFDADLKSVRNSSFFTSAQIFWSKVRLG